MKLNGPSHKASHAERFYSLILLLYPKEHRREFGPSILQAFRDLYNDTQQTEGHVGARFWFHIIGDETKSVARERFAMMKGSVALKSYIYGLLLSLFLIVSIIWTNVIAPTYESDDEYTGTYILIYLGLFLFFVFCGFLASRKTGKIADGARVGAITALITIAIVTLTYFIIDNVFIVIVSKQPDKIYAFQHSTYATMRDYINAGFLRGLFTVVPVFGIVGAVCGAVGAFIRKLVVRPPGPSINLGAGV
jgi:hypothetical protein